MKSLYRAMLIIVLIGICNTSCKKLIEVGSPITSTNSGIVYASDATATGVLTSIYTNMSQNTIIGGGLTSLPLFTGLYADEFSLYSGVRDMASIAYSTNDLTSINTGGADYWNAIYPIIFATNSALEGLTESTTLSPGVKKQLLGEAKFIRAFCYLYLVNIYGDVPLVTTTDYKANALLGRTPSKDVYQQIFNDLKDAEQQLSENFVDGSLIKITTERTSPNKWAARSLLARAYLYSKDYINAENYATLLIDNKTLFDLTPINSVFLKNSKEAIWQLQPVGSFVTNTWDGYIFGLPSTGPNTSVNPVFLTPDFLSNFEQGDSRATEWIRTIVVGTNTYLYPYKYKINTTGAAVAEYSTVLRLSEQYLIRAEARINQNKINDGINDLNIIRTRARAVATGLVSNPLPALNGNLSKANALLAVEKERFVELFTEWGHRWFDLKRMSGYIDPSKTRAEEVLSVKKGNNWQSTDQLFPIPQSEMDKNPHLNGHQNPGYN